MLARRALPLLALPAIAAAQAPGYAWAVMRQGSRIGTHRVGFTQRGEELVAESELVITPRVLGVVVYRYEHRATEVTRRGRFVSAQSHHNRNGRIVEAQASVQADHVIMRHTGGELRMPAQAAPLSWWEPARFGAVPLFGMTEPKLLELRVAREAQPGGATRIRTEGDVQATLEYDARGRWVGYSVVGDDGTLVTYAPA